METRDLSIYLLLEATRWHQGQCSGPGHYDIWRARRMGRASRWRRGLTHLQDGMPWADPNGVLEAAIRRLEAEAQEKGVLLPALEGDREALDVMEELARDLVLA